MGETAVEIGPEQLEVIGSYVRSHLSEWISRSDILVAQRERDFEQRERTIRLEESIKNIQEQIQRGFEYMEKRFELADKRSDNLREDMRTQFNRVYGFLTGLFLAVAGGFITVVIQL